MPDASKPLPGCEYRAGDNQYFTISCGILACKFCSLLVITVKECLTYVVEQACRFLVYIPVILGTTGSVRATAPQGLLVELMRSASREPMMLAPILPFPMGSDFDSHSWSGL